MPADVDSIVDISPQREKFFGCTGKMLLPSRDTVEAMVRRVPEREVLTVDALREALARQFGVEVTCPAATQKALRAIGHDPRQEAPYWRVVKRGGELMTIFPGGPAAQAARLLAEGQVVDMTRKVPSVPLAKRG